MKKIISTLLIIFCCCFGIFANDDADIEVSEETASSANTEIQTAAKSQTTIHEDFFGILPNMIGASLVIYIADVDTIIRGKLQNVYADGIVVKTAFNQTIFISKKSIAYFEIKDANAYDF